MASEDLPPVANGTRECKSDVAMESRGSLGSEPFSRHNLSEEGEAVLASESDYMSVDFIGNEVEGAVVELPESQFERESGDRDMIYVYLFMNSGCKSIKKSV